MVDTEGLTPARRVAYLTERGILLLLQRLIFRQSRADVAVSTLERHCAHVLVEAELLEEWNEAVVSVRVANGDDLLVALTEEATRFDAFLSVSPPGFDVSRRELLKDQHRQAGVRRDVRTQLEVRKAELN